MNRNPAITPPSTPLRAPTDAARYVPGHVLAGRYRMIARLGKGGMGEVWRADDLVLGTQVALKLIYSADPEARKVILDEVRLARQITHPAICRVFDVGEGPGEVFYSMELVHGEDLATLVRRMGRLPAEKVIDIGQQLCDGLAAAHAQGILHRDLKPANVLIDAGRARAHYGFRHRDHPGCREQRAADRHATLHGARAAGLGHAAVGADGYLRRRADSLRAARRATRV